MGVKGHRRPEQLDVEDASTAAIIELASKYGRYGYRRITALFRRDDWCVNHKLVARIWRRGHEDGSVAQQGFVQIDMCRPPTRHESNADVHSSAIY